MKTVTTIAINLLLSIVASAQFGIAPNFTVMDINENSFNLYEELDTGKPVILACMATWSEISFNIHNRHLLEELYLRYGPEGTNQIRILFYEGDINTSLQDLQGMAGNTLGNWTNGVSYPIVNESLLQLPLEFYAPQGFPSIKIISPDDYEITNDISYTETVDEIEAALNQMITLFEDTEQDFNVSYTTSDISCFEANDGEIYLNISGGFLPYHIEWFDHSSDTSKLNLPPGEYAVSVVDALGNTFLENIVIYEPPALEITNVQISPETNNQQNGSISLTIEGGTLPYNFEWNTGYTDTILEGVENGEYSITIIDANFCKLSEMFFIDMETSLIEPMASNLLLFPNPASNFINIKNLKKEKIAFEITHSTGQIVQKGNMTDNRVKLENLPSGYYQVLFIHEKEKIRMQFIKH